ncbi:MAG TPA: hypothetical protein VF400_08350, partial [Anaeromyxobacteraceae bacterium]
MSAPVEREAGRVAAGDELPPLVLAVNPGAGSTKLGLYRGGSAVAEHVLRHDAAELARFRRVADQLPWRAEAVRAWLAGRVPPG